MRIYYVSKNSFKAALLVALIAVPVVLGIVFWQSQSFLVSRVDVPHYQGSTNSKAIAFTFNVDWGEEHLPSLLNVLQESDVKATFFITGRWAKSHPDLVKQIAKAGHEIGNHGKAHQHVKDLSRAGVEDEIKGGEIILQSITGKKPVLYAPAFGEYDKQIGEAADSLDYEIIMWSLDTIDWQNPDVATIVRRVVPRIHNDAIILMHPTKPTVEALPSMIKELKAQGYKFLTVSSIIKPPAEENAKENQGSKVTR